MHINDQADGGGNEDTLDTPFGELRMGSLTSISQPATTGEFSIYFDDNGMENFWLAVTWGKNN